MINFYFLKNKLFLHFLCKHTFSLQMITNLVRDLDMYFCHCICYDKIKKNNLFTPYIF